MHTVGYYLSLQVLICAIAWMNFENSVLGEIDYLQEDKDCVIPLMRYLE